jgi:ABC-type Fe3+ transport system permease subunit
MFGVDLGGYAILVVALFILFVVFLGFLMPIFVYMISSKMTDVLVTLNSIENTLEENAEFNQKALNAIEKSLRISKEN